MIRPMSLQETQKITGGELLGADISFDSVSIDTRTLHNNELFIAISGPNFNGNNFVAEAAQQQAIAAIVSEELEVNLPTLKVSDTRIALGKIAKANRKNSTACVIALTGSQGKTTVKEMTAEILSNCGQVVSTEGNLNNDYGVPLSLLKINAEHDFAVIEMGASGPDEIAYCVALTKPKIAHITNIAGTHLEGFGDIAGVAKAKAELWEGLDENGIAVINMDDNFSQDWSQYFEGKNTRSVTLSANGKQSANYFLSALNFNKDLTTDFTLHTPQGIKTIHLHLAGKHNAANAIAAAALSMEAGASLDDVAKGLSKIEAVPGRFCLRSGLNSSSIIDDTYNASPASFEAAIDVMSTLSGKKIIVVGDMGELGEEAEIAHKKIGLYAKEKGIDVLFATGKLSALAAGSFGEGARFNSDRDALANEIIPSLNKDVTVLVKGSRSAGMDKLVQLLLKRGE